MDSSSVSFSSSVPPGSDHAPRNGSRARSQSRTCSASSRIWSTTASAAWAGEGSVVDCAIEVIACEAKTTMTWRTATRSEHDADVLVVGGGVAGLFAALCAASEARVLVLSKGELLASTSSLAQGGIAAALGPDDSAELHAEDTLRAGRGLSRPSAVAALTAEAPARIRDLEELGVEFDQGLGLEGGHSRRRVVHAGGAATGDRVARVLAERVVSHPRIRVVEGERVLEVRRSDGRCDGVLTDRRPIAAPATVLATGGASALWERTTNPA